MTTFVLHFSFLMDVVSTQELENSRDCSFPHLLPELLLIFFKLPSFLFGCKRFAFVVRLWPLNSSVIHIATPRRKWSRRIRISTRSARLGVVSFWCVQSIPKVTGDNLISRSDNTFVHTSIRNKICPSCTRGIHIMWSKEQQSLYCTNHGLWMGES